MAVTPEYLTYRLDMLSVTEELQESILRDIIRRLIKTDFTLSDTAKWQIEKLAQSGMLEEEIYRRIKAAIPKAKKEIRNEFEAIRDEVYSFDEERIPTELGDIRMTPQRLKTLNAALTKTTTEAVNLTRTTAYTSQTAFISACDLAHEKIVSGAFSYQEAIYSAVMQTSIADGVTVLYPSGARANVTTAIRRAVLTGVNQTAAKLQLDLCDSLEVDLVEVSAHFGARPDHAEWQGQVYSRSGKNPDYDSFDVCGYGTVQGLCGANCRHNFYPFFEGISVRNYTDGELEELKNAEVTYNGEKLPAWRAIEQQRYMERSIRRDKTKLVVLDEQMKGTADKNELAKLQKRFEKRAVSLKDKEARLSDFCRQTGLKRDSFRTRMFSAQTENGIKGFGHSVAGKAVWADRKALTKISLDDMIKHIDVDDFHTMTSDRGIDERVLTEILEVIKRYETTNTCYVNEVVCARLGKTTLMQTEPIPMGRMCGCRITINEALLGGVSYDELNARIAKGTRSIIQNVTEAAIHEMGHAKVIYRLSLSDADKAINSLKNKGVYGISHIAEEDGNECIAEVEVLLARNATDIPAKAIELYRRYAEKGGSAK